jgi:diguanylate cyclase
MNRVRDELDDRVTSALEDQALQDNALRPLLEEVWSAHQDLIRRIDRISRISDAYQSETKRNETSLALRLKKQLRQLEKVARISDHYQKMLHDLNLALRDASNQDALTGLPNRRPMIERLRDEASRHVRYQRPFSVAMLDIDHFKQINDRYGHEIGDKVLIEVARVLKAAMRDQDLCGRWGGEEFLVLMPETAQGAASLVVERVRSAIERLQVRVDEEAIGVTISIGLAQHMDGDTYSDTINRADAALLSAKRGGRNRFEQAAGGDSEA